MEPVPEAAPMDTGAPAGDLVPERFGCPPEGPPVSSLRSYVVRLASAAALVATFLVVDALVSRPQIQTASGTVPFTTQGYLHTAPGQVVFVYLGRSGTTVTGTLTGAYLEGSSPRQLQRAAGTFSGSIDDTRIVLSIDGTSDPGRTWTGTLSGNHLVLSYPTPQGSLTTIGFESSTVEAYDRAVARLDG